jgi:actin related protein 2/3 complex, subunit 5
MASLDFRKINIDQYDEDQLLEDELYEADPRDPATVLADAKSKATAVRALIAKSVKLINSSSKPYLSAL